MHLKTSLRHLLLKRSAPLQYLSQRLPLSTQHERVYESVYPALSIPRQNTADYCMSRFDKYAPHPALECSLTGKKLTYADVQSMTQRFGSQLLDSGLKPGDRIAALVPNCPEFGPLLLGALPESHHSGPEPQRRQGSRNQQVTTVKCSSQGRQ